MVIGSNQRSWSVDVPFDHFDQNTPPEVVKLAKIAVFIENIFKICKKTYPFEFRGGWGLLVFHKYFLVVLAIRVFSGPPIFNKCSELSVAFVLYTNTVLTF